MPLQFIPCSQFTSLGGETDQIGPVSVGENIGTSAAKKSPTETVKVWFDQKDEYNYDANRCLTFCGTYKQVMRSYSVVFMKVEIKAKEK